MIGRDRLSTLKRATKRAMRRARRMGKPVGWKVARKRGEDWCQSMWSDFFVTKRGGRK